MHMDGGPDALSSWEGADHVHGRGHGYDYDHERKPLTPGERYCLWHEMADKRMAPLEERGRRLGRLMAGRRSRWRGWI